MKGLRRHLSHDVHVPFHAEQLIFMLAFLCWHIYTKAASCKISAGFTFSLSGSVGTIGDAAVELKYRYSITGLEVD